MTLTRKISLMAAVMAGLAVLAFSGVSQAASPLSLDQDVPVAFDAGLITHDNVNQTVIASDHVEMVQGTKILKADKVVYRLDTDTVSALGNVSLIDKDGNTHTAEYLELTKDMKNGFIHGLQSMLQDGSRFTAAEARRIDGTKTEMKDATYTPCKICEGKSPFWQLRASKVTYDQKEKSVGYKNARLEVLGVPVMYTPLFSHPEGVRSKSGFLRPDAGWTSERGTFAQLGYFYNIAKNKDMTVMLEPTTRAGVLGLLEWRQRFKNGQIKLNGGAVNSDRFSASGDVEGSRTRAHFFGTGRFDLNQYWRTGFDAARASDNEYLRLYDLSDEDVLENRLYAERFSGRNYTNISAYHFQDVRLGSRPDQPDILPSFEHSMLGNPASLLGGRWSLDLGGLGLNRTGAGQDVYRASVDAGWQRRFVLPQGLVTTVDAKTRADLYSINDRDVATPGSGLSTSSHAARFFPQLNILNQYPMVRSFGAAAQMLVEPMISATAGPNLNNGSIKIPNEDSVDVQLDASNLFDGNRFPGEDLQDDGTRVTYGLKTGLYDFDGKYGNIFLGQSYRLTDDSAFPVQSGLENKSSDIVGKVDMGLQDYLDLTYNFQLSDRNLRIRRHEASAEGGNDIFRLNSRYVYAAPVIGTGFDEARQQLQAGGSVKLNEFWTFKANSITDLGAEPGLRRALAGIEYANECFSFSLTGDRDITERASGNNGTTLLVRLWFKNLGAVSTPEIFLNQQDDKID